MSSDRHLAVSRAQHIRREPAGNPVGLERRRHTRIRSEASAATAGGACWPNRTSVLMAHARKQRRADLLLYWLLPILGLATVFVRRRVLAIPEAAIAVMLSTLALCSNLVFLRHPLEARLPDVGLSQSVLAAWIGASAWRWWPAPGIRRRLTRGVVVLVTAAALSAVAVFGETGKLLAAAGVFQGPGEVVRAARHLRAASRHESWVRSRAIRRECCSRSSSVRECTGPEDRLLYGWYTPELNVVTGRGFAGDHRRLYRRLSSWEQAATISHLRRVRVPFLIIPVDRHLWFADTYPISGVPEASHADGGDPTRRRTRF